MVKHINRALPAKPHTAMYLTHKFWGRKPHNVVATYINTYSQPNNIVLDPFLGSGVTAIESLRLKRRAVAMDLNPLSILLTKVMVLPVKVEELDRAFSRLANELRDKINEFYKTKCRKCGAAAIGLNFIWSSKAECPKCRASVTSISASKRKEERSTFQCPNCASDVVIGETAPKELVQVQYKCLACGAGKKKSEQAPPSPDDMQKIAEVESRPIPYWYPQDKFSYEHGQHFQEARNLDNVSDLFTKRNLHSLALILDAIEKELEGKVGDVFTVVFTSCLEQASKLNAVDLRKGRELQTRGWTMYRYWVAPTVIERNVWDAFEDRYRKMKRAKIESNKQIPKVALAQTFQALRGNRNLLLMTGNAVNLPVPENKVDYVFTDPPYGEVQYGELSFLWNAWLKLPFDFEGEVVINRNQGKDHDYFYRTLCSAFKELFRVLKPSKYFTLTFHSPNIRTWNSIIKASVVAGFMIEKILYQPPAVKSAKAGFQPFGTAVGDFYVRFKKPRAVAKLVSKDEVDKQRYENIVVHTATRVIAARGEPTSYSVIINTVYPELIANGVLLDADRDIEEIMKEHVGKEFILVDRTDALGQKIGQEWWFRDPSTVRFLKQVPLSERIERAVIDVLNDKTLVTMDDILDKIYTSFPNALTPDTERILDFLEEYATKSKNGMWLRKPAILRKEMVREHNELVRMLAELGTRLGFRVYADLDTYRDDFPRMPNLSASAAARVRRIDVLWHNGRNVVWEFEVEHTTSITEAVNRGSNLQQPEVRRTLVMPAARRKMMQRKMQDPMLKENITRYGWTDISFEDLRKFTEVKKPGLAELQQLCVPPQSRREKQGAQQQLLTFPQTNPP